VIVGNEPQIIRELSTHKPIVSSLSGASPIWGIRENQAIRGNGEGGPAAARSQSIPAEPARLNANGEPEMPSLLEIGKRAAMVAEREAIERVLAQTRWNRRQAAKILKISYKALLNKLKVIEEQNQSQGKQRLA
jgi:DNA-binding NtrC family response regulator